MDRARTSRPPEEGAKRRAGTLSGAVVRDRALRADRKREGHASTGRQEGSQARLADPTWVQVAGTQAINSTTSGMGRSMCGRNIMWQGFLGHSFFDSGDVDADEAVLLPYESWRRTSASRSVYEGSRAPRYGARPENGCSGNAGSRRPQRVAPVTKVSFKTSASKR